ncbi:MAG: hypothetical protein AAF648_08375 [Pseudomonadota bacterium]
MKKSGSAAARTALVALTFSLAAHADSTDSVRKTFDALYPRVEQHDARAMVELSDLLTYRCAFAFNHDSIADLRSYHERSGLAGGSYATEKLQEFDGCRYALAQAPNGAHPVDWGSKLLARAAQRGDLVAEFTLATYGGNEARYLDEHPQVLNEHHPRPRLVAFNLLASAKPSMMEDEIEYNAWAASVCETTPGCSLTQEWVELSKTLTESTVNRIKTEFRKLSERFARNDPFHFQKVLESRRSTSANRTGVQANNGDPCRREVATSRRAQPALSVECWYVEHQ